VSSITFLIPSRLKKKWLQANFTNRVKVTASD